MPLETAVYLSDLEPANPAPTDQLAQADEHLRLIKSVLQTTFPNIDGPVTATPDQLNAPFFLPTGSIIMWYGTVGAIPAGWTLCNGVAVPRSDATGNITPPDLRDRVPLGVGTTINALGGTVGANAVSTNTGVAGTHNHTISGGAHSHTGSALGHTLTEAEIPQHRHFTLLGATGGFSGTPNANESIYAITDNGNSGSAFLAKTAAEPDVGRTSIAGGGNAHTHDLQIDSSTHSHASSDEGSHQHSISLSTLQPSVGVHFIMKT